MPFYCVYTPANAAPGQSNIVKFGAVGDPRQIAAQGNPPATIAMQTAMRTPNNLFTVDTTTDPPSVVAIT